MQINAEGKESTKFAANNVSKSGHHILIVAHNDAEDRDSTKFTTQNAAEKIGCAQCCQLSSDGGRS